MKLSVERFVQLGFLLAGFLLLLAVVLRSPDHSQPADQPEVRPADATGLLNPQPLDGPAPSFALPGRDGKQVKLSELRGRHVLLGFWATWCKSCKEDLPHLMILARSLKNGPVMVVLVSVDENWELVDALAKNLERVHGGQTGTGIMTQTVEMMRGKMDNVIMLLDSTGRVPKSYGTEKYPETYLIDPNGQLKARFVGPKAWGSRESIGYFSRL